MDGSMNPPMEPAGHATFDPIEQRRRLGRDKKRRQRAAMTEEQRQAIRARDAEGDRRRRAAMTEEQLQAVRARDAEDHRRRGAAMTEEERAAKGKKDAKRNQ